MRTEENLIGKKFGKWSVIDKSENRSKNNKTLWICKCECGNISEILGPMLKSGKTKGCGKGKCSSSFKDLTGMKFGKLKVIELLNKQGSNGNYFWKCLCNCGNYTEVQGTYLLNGNIIGCGKCKYIDITGQKFGRLQVIEKSEYTNSAKEIYWKCICDCGNECHVKGVSLRSGYKSSCGKCLKNMYITVDDITLVYCNDNQYFIIDTEDINKISNYTWIIRHGYPSATINNTTVNVHQLIFSVSEGKVRDHISRDRKDNRKCNLREANSYENVWNSRKRSNNTTGYIGVQYVKSKECYMAVFHSKGKRKIIGEFVDLIHAAKEYDIAILKDRGDNEFSVYNFPELKNEYLIEIERRKNVV